MSRSPPSNAVLDTWTLRSWFLICNSYVMVVKHHSGVFLHASFKRNLRFQHPKTVTRNQEEALDDDLMMTSSLSHDIAYEQGSRTRRGKGTEFAGLHVRRAHRDSLEWIAGDAERPEFGAYECNAIQQLTFKWQLWLDLCLVSLVYIYKKKVSYSS